MIHNLKLRPKFILSLLFIAVLPLLIIAVVNYFYLKTELEKKTIGNLRAINDSRAAHINRFIQLRQEQAKELAGTYLIRQLRAEGANPPEVIQRIQFQIESVFQKLKARPRSDYQFIDRASSIDNISIWDIHGNIVANTDKSLIGRKMPFTFLHILYEKGAFFKGFEKDPLTGENYLTILEGIRNWDNGKYSGVVLLKSKAALNEITTAREGLGESAETYIVDSQYRMITESRFMPEAVLKVRVMNEATQACFDGREGPRIYKNYLGKPVLGVQRFLPDQKWCLVTEIDTQEAFQPIQTFRKNIQVILVFLAGLIGFFVWLAGRAFIRPILEMRKAALKVASGKYDIRLPVPSQDEIGELAKAFNIMAANLSAVTQELKNKNAQLEEQKHLLEKVNAELDGFVYTASHDLRAPLRGIASFAQFLEEDYYDKLDDEGKDHLKEIRAGADRLSRLIEDLLTLSRISRIKNPYENVDTGALVREMAERIKFDIKEKNVELIIQGNMPTVVCDRIKIGEVFLNLINNAIKFSSKTPSGRPRVEVGCRDEGDVFCFYVRDNGIGIDPQYHDQIFGIFKRLHTAKEYEGSGAGLSIVKRVIDDHGGRIWVESEVGKGATFYFTIPKNLPLGDSEDEASESGKGQSDGAAKINKNETSN